MFPSNVSASTIDSYGIVYYDSDAYLSQTNQTTSINSAHGQTFNVTQDYNLTSLAIYTYKTGSPAGYLQAAIYNITGTYGVNSTATGAALIESTAIDISTVSASNALTTFTFAETELTTGPYALVVWVVNSTALDSENFVGVGLDSSSPTHSGNYFYYDGVNSPVGYVADSSKDLIFYVYGDSDAADPHAAGELYLWVQFWMSAGDSNAERILNASDTSGLTIWIDSGNWNSPQLTSEYINYFHQSDVKVACRIWTAQGTHTLNQVLHNMGTPYMPNGVEDTDGQMSGGSVDYQISIGPEIDAFIFDECDMGNTAYYQAISDYVHSLGKLCFVNPGGSHYNIDDFVSETDVDHITAEYLWNGYIVYESDLLAAEPTRFGGVSKDFGYQVAGYVNPDYYPLSYILPIEDGTDSEGNYRPSAETTITLERALYDTWYAWDNGIYMMSAVPSEPGYLPEWWEEYVAALAETEPDPPPEPPTPTPAPTMPPVTTPTPTPTATPTAAPTPGPTGVQYAATLSVGLYWQYLYEGDLLGFFQAIYLANFLHLDILYGTIVMLFLVPIYLRTKSLSLLSTLWILLGSFFIVAMPAVSGLAVLFLVLGVGSTFWRLVKPKY